jgi:hypothetical protein
MQRITRILAEKEKIRENPLPRFFVGLLCELCAFARDRSKVGKK